MSKKVAIISNCIICVMLLSLVSLSYISSTNSQTVTASSKIIYNGDTNSNKVSFMINVYWGTEFLEEILKTLDSYSAKCTFFIGGCWADDNNEIVNAFVERGHELGNHGYFHKDHKNLNLEGNKNEIMQNHKLIREIAGIEMNLFAPPSGSIGNSMIDVCVANNYKIIMWTRDTIDWRDKNEDIIYTRAIKNIKGGDLVLMHPTEATAKALPKILEYCKQNNLAVTTVTDNLGI